MNEDFSNINLFFTEKVKLFIMRFKRNVSEDFLGDSCRFLTSIKFVHASYEFRDTLAGLPPSPVFYTLTRRYYRYCVYRRNKFFDSKIWPFFISVAAAVITSIITSYITSSITLQLILK